MAASEYIVSAANLRAMADAIREKTGQAGLITPNQMSAAIASIPSGGGVTVEPLSVTTNGVYPAPAGKAFSPVSVSVRNVDAEDKDINFYDVDGVRLFSYTREEFAALSALPTAPDRPDLFLNFTMWNWTKEEIDAQPGYVEVGALYDLTDCDCALVVEPMVSTQRNATVRFYCGSGNTVSLDWGDGSQAETYTQSGSTQTVATHTWPKLYQRYRIRLTRTAGTSAIQLGGNANANLMYGTHGDKASMSPIREIYIGSACTTGAVLLSYAALKRCVYCTTAEKKTGNIYFVGNAFILNRNSNYAQSACANSDIRKRILPAGNSFLPFSVSDGLRYNNSDKLTIPNGVTKLATRSLGSNHHFGVPHIPESVSIIASTAISNEFEEPEAMRELWFHGTTPPTASASNSIILRAFTIIFVPYSAIAAYLTGTNYPNPSVNQYIGYATYSNGVPLPSVDSTNTYNITWYDNKGDAAAGENPITEGNGTQIYCRAEVIA